MAHSLLSLLLTATPSLLLLSATPSEALQTCPGFPGFCSESFPGQTCNVVCDFGRNNVPLCQDDGTWTDIPRCIEHEPGVDNQIPGICPGIPGYCAQGFLNGRCNFDCVTGADINSVCTSDGTWVPYPVCEGDLRETRDGCDGCPGPLGGARNRTAEGVLTGAPTPISNSRIPKAGSVDSSRKNIPSFAGNIQFGPVATEKPAQPSQFNSFRQQQQNTFQQQQNRFPQQNRFQQQPQQNRFPQQPQQNRAPQQQQTQFQQQPAQQQSFQQGLNTFQPGGQQQQPLSLFDQIKSMIQQGNREKQQQAPTQQQVQPQQQQQLQPQQQFQPQQQQQFQPQQQQQFQPQQQQQFQPQTQGVRQAAAREPLPAPVATQQPEGAGFPTFGPFESVNLANALQGAERPRPVAPARSRLVDRPAVQRVNDDNFFGVFPSVDLQG